MGIINIPDIWTILEKGGYDCDIIDDETWDKHNNNFEEECEKFLKQIIKERKNIILVEWSNRLGLNKK